MNPNTSEYGPMSSHNLVGGVRLSQDELISNNQVRTHASLTGSSNNNKERRNVPLSVNKRKNMIPSDYIVENNREVAKQKLNLGGDQQPQ